MGQIEACEAVRDLNDQSAEHAITKIDPSTYYSSDCSFSNP